jgi:hypothetical protein
MFVTEHFLSDIVGRLVDSHLYRWDGTWYPPQACRFLKLVYHLHSTFEKSVIKRTMQYIQDRTKNVL